MKKRYKEAKHNWKHVKSGIKSQLADVKGGLVDKLKGKVTIPKWWKILFISPFMTIYSIEIVVGKKIYKCWNVQNCIIENYSSTPKAISWKFAEISEPIRPLPLPKLCITWKKLLVLKSIIVHNIMSQQPNLHSVVQNCVYKVIYITIQLLLLTGNTRVYSSLK